MINFENSCQAAFACCPKCWHGYTSGKETSILFVSDEDFAFVMNVIAQAYLLFAGKIIILAFEVMNNHFHFVLSGEMDDVQAFFDFIKKRIGREFPLVRKLTFSLKPIADIKSLRNNIIYVNRNGYVANPSHTPFSYPWGTGPYYFNTPHHDGLIREESIPKLRLMFRGRAPQVPDEWKLNGGYITPDSYCDMALGMSLFKDAHQYFAMVSKNIEAYAELATELDDCEFMTDSELFSQMTKIVKEGYGASLISDLSRAQKLDLARLIRRKYRSSNGQIRRVLGLSQFEVDSLFPLSK